MGTVFAALIFRPDRVPEPALREGFAVALAGFDVPAPRLLVAPLAGVPGHHAAFYRSGAFPHGAEDDELDHACELFESELPPGALVVEAARALGASDPTVYAITYSDEVVHDDAWRFDAAGYARRFVREGDAGEIEAGVDTADHHEVVPIDVPVAEEASDAEWSAAVERAALPHRGSTYLAGELGWPILGSLVGALFVAERRIDERLIEPGADATAAEARRLDATLRRVEGRGTFEPPSAVTGIGPPDVYGAFVRAYDWADSADPADLYRELAIGRIEGTLRFLRSDDLHALSASPVWARAAARSLFPVASLATKALGGSARPVGWIALEPDGDALAVVRPDGRIEPAGPTFGELLRYLALGWKRRTPYEEEMPPLPSSRISSDSGNTPRTGAPYVSSTLRRSSSKSSRARAEVRDLGVAGALAREAHRDAGPEQHGVERLRQIVVGAPRDAARDARHVVDRRDDDDRQLAERRVGLHALEHVEAVEPRHGQIEQHDVAGLAREQLEGRGAALGEQHAVALPREAPREHVAVRLLVVDHEDAPALPAVRLARVDGVGVELERDVARHGRRRHGRAQRFARGAQPVGLLDLAEPIQKPLCGEVDAPEVVAGGAPLGVLEHHLDVAEH